MSTKLKIAYAIDNPQTLQAIIGLLEQSIARKHTISVFSCFPFNIAGKFKNFSFHDKHEMIKSLSTVTCEYDAIVGINVFNNVS